MEVFLTADSHADGRQKQMRKTLLRKTFFATVIELPRSAFLQSSEAHCDILNIKIVCD
jgi:hypothetical protein